jgi:hypothetical protein
MAIALNLPGLVALEEIVADAEIEILPFDGSLVKLALQAFAR